ncbi:MAG: hypothetical protein F6K04_15160 [Leptolyngbya sp. SIO4C5]|nr:hypothetical protein [Leptolyngbya sp. SIO4C5]
MNWFEEIFPSLGSENLHPEISPEDNRYNGIAYSISRKEKDRYWWPDPFGIYYWPRDVPREESRQAFIEMYFSLGYEFCDNPELEQGIEKVAIYVDSEGKPTHAARQSEDGYWESKIIDAEDIRHTNLECLQGEMFGSVWRILRRRRRS